MARFDNAIEVVLKHEGGRFVDDKSIGEVSKYGLTARFLRSIGLPSKPEDVNNLTEEQAKAIYREYWWDRYNLDRIADQRVATKVFDMMVNMGPVRAVYILQQALLESGIYLKVDGIIGRQTITAVNEVDPDELLSHIRERHAAYYKLLAARDERYAKYLDGWLKRAAT